MPLPRLSMSKLVLLGDKLNLEADAMCYTDALLALTVVWI